VRLFSALRVRVTPPVSRPHRRRGPILPILALLAASGVLAAAPPGARFEPVGPEQMVLPGRWLVALDLPSAVLEPSAARGARAREADLAFREALAALAPEDAPSPPRVVRRFDRLWNGYAVEADTQTAARLEDLPGVRRVYPERPVWALLDVSVPLIGADVLHGGVPPLTGAGVRIAVLDTGVDYNHDDLGGWIGPGLKVETGWDFVDDDSDPMDEHGHGTLVAAVSAGDGTAAGAPWPGVAPGATILAGRVLASTGFGNQADLIAGLEWAADPDGNSGTDDGADVVLMALGGFGFPDDPVSQAVDALAAQGVLVVVGTGNFGHAGTTYQSVLSPGTARGALTVGATDDLDGLVEWSSRGFVGPFLPKPDLVAPGLDVCAARHDQFLPAFTCEDVEHVEADGTSISAAHVAGAAALVWEAHPGWTAEEVGAALRETALDLGFDLLTQGSGRLRVDAAAVADAVVLPPVLVPGRVDLCAASWSGGAPFVVRNLGAGAADFEVALDFAPLPGVSVGLDANLIPALPPGGEATVNLQVDVDPSAAPVVDSPPFGYTGAVVVTSPVRPGLELRVPFWVPASPSLPLSFAFDPMEVFVHDRAGGVWRYMAPGRELEAALPAGTYDVLAVTGGLPRPPLHLVLREGLEVDPCSTPPVTMDLSEAPHAVAVSWKDARGSALPDPPAWCHLVLRHDGGFLYETIKPPIEVLHLSGASPSYRLEWSCADRDRAGEICLGTGSVTGLAADLEVNTGPSDWRRLEVAGRREPSFLWLGASPARSVLLPLLLAVSDPALEGPGPDEAGVVRDAWLTPLPYEGFAAMSGFAFTVGPDPHPPEAVPASLRSVVVQSRDASLDLLHFETGTSTPLASLPPEDARLTLGLSPYGWAAATRNLPPLLVRLFPAMGSDLALFRGQLGTHRPQASAPSAGLPYELRRNGNPVQSGLLTHPGGGFAAPLVFLVEMDNGPLELEVSFPAYEVAGTSGTATALLTIDMDNPRDPDPPAMWRLQLLVNGLPSDQVPNCDPPARLRVDFTEDAATLVGFTAEIRPTGTGAWTPLAPVVAGSGYEAPLVHLGAGGPVDLRLTVRDPAGNSLEYRAEPAYLELTGGAANPLGSLRVRRLGGDVLLAWEGTPSGPYLVRSRENVPLAPGDEVATVPGLSWRDRGAAGDGRRLVYYAAFGTCP